MDGPIIHNRASLAATMRKFPNAARWVSGVAINWFFGMGWLQAATGILKTVTDTGVELSVDAGALATIQEGLGVGAGRRAVITAAASTDGYYEATEQIWDDSVGAWIDKTGGYDFDAAGVGELIEANLNDHVPIGVQVRVFRFVGDDGDSHWGFDWHEWEAWATPTADLGSGSYTCAILQGDASTTTGASVTAEEVSGREGIVLASDTVFRLFVDPTDGADIKFEYHGAAQGTIDVADYADQIAPYSDTWSRDSQGGTRGDREQFVARLHATSGGELYYYARTRDDDANGHKDERSAEGRTLLGILEASTNTIPYRDCSDDSVVARFDADNVPAHDYCWIYDGTTFVACYRDTASAGAATSPVPCVVLQATDPGSCGGLDSSVFGDDFNGTNGDTLDTCEWTRISTAGTAEIQSNKLEISVPEDSTTDDGEEKWEHAYVFEGDFDIQVTIDSTGLDVMTAAGEYLRADFQLVGAGATFRALTIGAWPSDSGFLASQFGYDFQQDGSPSSNNGAALAAGSHVFRFVRVGMALTGYINGNSFSFNATSGDLQMRLRVIGTGSSNPAISATFDNLTVSE